MKPLRPLAAGVLAAIALNMLTGTGTASTALFTGVTKLPGGTVINASLALGTSALLSTTDGKSIVDKCTTSDYYGETNFTTSISITSHGSSTTWKNCSFTTHNETTGNISVSWISGTNDGTLTGAFGKTKINIGVECMYGTGGGAHLGTLKGKLLMSEHARIVINAVINEQEPKQFLCPDTTKWTAEYVVNSPTGLNVGP